MTDAESQSGSSPANRRKRIMLLNRRVPHGSIYTQEALDIALMGAAFEQDLSLAFLDDGVFALKKGQQTDTVALKNFARGWRALPDYDIDTFYVEEESLASRALGVSDLVMDVRLVSRVTLTNLMDEQDLLLEI